MTRGLVIQRPRLRASVRVYLSGNVASFLMLNTRRVQRFEVNDIMARMLALLDGSRTMDQLERELRAAVGPISREEVEAAVQMLADNGLVQDAMAQPPEGWFTPDELARYGRQLDFLADFATVTHTAYDFQKALKDARVALFGLGGTGSNLLLQLAGCGVGHVRVFDFDRVALSNLARQVLYTQEDVGIPKVEAAARHIAALNRHVTVEPRSLQLREGLDYKREIEGCALVINCTDEPSIGDTTRWLQPACFALDVPLIMGGGYNRHLGYLAMTILPKRTACATCLMLALEREQVELSREWGEPLVLDSMDDVAGSLAPIAAVMAGITAWETIRLLTGICPPRLINCRAELDFQTLKLQWHTVERQPFCPTCGT